MRVHCHKLVAETARKCAGELYDRLMGDDLLFKEWKRQNHGASAKALEFRFIQKNWPQCIPVARATLAAMLRGAIDPALKEEILEALILDNTLIHARPIAQAPLRTD